MFFTFVGRTKRLIGTARKKNSSTSLSQPEPIPQYHIYRIKPTVGNNNNRLSNLSLKRPTRDNRTMPTRQDYNIIVIILLCRYHVGTYYTIII